MSQNRELLQIGIDRSAHPTTAERWEEARAVVAAELGKDPDQLSRWEIVRELTEAYTGGEPLGGWRDE